MTRKLLYILPEISVVHKPAQAESRPGLEPARLMAPWTQGLSRAQTYTRATKKPPRAAKRLESRVRVGSWTPVRAGSSRQGARVGSSTPVRAAKSWMPRDSSRLKSSPELGSSRFGLVAPQGLCTTLPQIRRHLARAVTGISIVDLLYLFGYGL